MQGIRPTLVAIWGEETSKVISNNNYRKKFKKDLKYEKYNVLLKSSFGCKIFINFQETSKKPKN